MTSSTKDGKKTTYSYAGADMNRLLSQRTEDGPEYKYTYGKGLTSREVSGSGVASVLTDPTTGQPLNLRTTDGATSMWVLDGIGSPAAAIADTGEKAYTVSYDPYGTEVVTYGEDSQQWKQNPFGFKGGIRAGEKNSLTKFGYRWQSATTGGWTQRDTFDAPLDPNNANRYAYAGDDPINSSDSTGRWVNVSLNVCVIVCGSFGRSQYGSDWAVNGGLGLAPSKGVGPSVSWGEGAAGADEGWTTDYSVGPVTGSRSDSGEWSYSLDPTNFGPSAGIGRSYNTVMPVTY